MDDKYRNPQEDADYSRYDGNLGFWVAFSAIVGIIIIVGVFAIFAIR